MSDTKKIPPRKFEAIGVSLHYGVWEIQWRVDGFTHRAWLPMCQSEAEARKKLEQYVGHRNGKDSSQGRSWVAPLGEIP